VEFRSKISTARLPRIRRAEPLTLFYKLECNACDQIFGTKWTRESVSMWKAFPSIKSNDVCSLCGSYQINCKLINKAEYDELQRIWDLEDLQSKLPKEDDDDDIPVFDLSNFS